MKISYNWLQDYFDKPLPKPEEVARLFSEHLSEVESSEMVGDDTVFDIKILADRAHYALSHFGMAYELSAIAGLPMKNRFSKESLGVQSAELVLESADPRCRRTVMAVIKNLAAAASPAWLRTPLERIGQRSINAIVDVTNYAMFDLLQPLHAFDFDKLKKKDGTVRIVLRNAHPGEKITILGGKELALKPDTLVFADANNDDVALDIAGVKGGTVAEIDGKTKNIVLIAANFEPTYIRRTSIYYGLRSEASKRSENNITPELAIEGAKKAVELFKKNSAAAEVEGHVDYYPTPWKSKTVAVAGSYINERLGLSLSAGEIERIFGGLRFEVSKRADMYDITPPFYRLDISIPEDVVDEVGRLYGYDKIKPVLPPKSTLARPVNKNFYYAAKIRAILAALGFSEIYTSSFDKKGDLEVAYPVASDKSHLRTALSKNMEAALEFNVRNAELLGLDAVKLFEIGKVFPNGIEHTALCVAIAQPKGKKGETVNAQIRQTREALVKALGADLSTVCTIDETGGMLMIDSTQIGHINQIDGLMALNLDLLVASLPEPQQWDIEPPKGESNYRPFSKYPFITRDVAVFVPSNISAADLLKVIKTETGPLLVNDRLFDEFKKGDKTSYAFRLVFQSSEKTLTDDEVNKIMEKVAAAIVKKGWQVR